MFLLLVVGMLYFTLLSSCYFSQGGRFMINSMFDAREVLIPGSAYDRSNGTSNGMYTNMHTHTHRGE